MEIRITKTYEEMSTATADFIAGEIRKKPDSLLCIPSGDTPTRTLALLVEYAQAKKINFSQCTFVGLDEWVGMDRDMPGSCQHYVYKHFFEPLNIPADRIVFFDARAQDLKKECTRIDDFIFKTGPIDLLLVGVGVNGHIGLNEPGSSFDSYCHHIALAASTREGAQKYFKDDRQVERGITLGIAHMMQAKTVVLIANGAKKAPVLKRIIEGPVTEDVPGSILQNHRHGILFLDKDAASALAPTSPV
jgi:glucosamine-6-phosphate isomerase